MEIDALTLRGLEVLSAASGRDGALLSVLDRTVDRHRSPLFLNCQLRCAPDRSGDDTPPPGRWCATRWCSAAASWASRGPRRAYAGHAAQALRPAVPRRRGPATSAAVRDGLRGRGRRASRKLKDAPDLPAGLATARRELLAWLDENSRDGLLAC